MEKSNQTLDKQPLNVIVNQVENGYIVYDTEFYRVGRAIHQRFGSDGSTPDLRKQYVCKDAQALADLLKKLADESLPLGAK